MIPLSFIPENVTTTDIVLYQDWSSDLFPVEINYREGDPMPSTKVLNIRVKDIFGTPLEDPLATRFFVTAYPFFGELTQFIGVTHSEDITSNDTFIDLDVSFIESAINSMPLGELSNIVWISLQKEVDGQVSPVSYFTVPVTIRKFAANGVVFSPLNFEFKYKPDSTLLPSAKTIEVYCPENTPWRIETLPITYLQLQSTYPNVDIQEVVSGTETTYIATGIGPALLLISIFDFPFPWIPNTAPFHLYTQVDNSLGTFIGIEDSKVIGTVKRTPLPTGSFFVDPTFFEFEAKKFTQEAEPQVLTIGYSENISIDIPLWLNKELVEDDAGIQLWSITPLNTANIGKGNYIGKIKVNHATVPPTSKSIDVAYKVVDSTSLIDLVHDDLNFTLDAKFIEAQTDNVETYLQLNLTVKIFDFYADTFKEYQVPLKVPFYKGSAKTAIGNIIHRLITPSPIYEQGRQYKEAIVEFSGVEKNYNTEEVLTVIGASEIRYIAGRTPDETNLDYYFLEQSPRATRVTKNSIALVNMYIKTAAYVSYIKNGLPFSIEFLAYQYLPVGICSTRLDFSTFDLQPGDVLELQIKDYNNTLEPIKKSFVCFPEEQYSFLIMWIDKYKLKQVYEFTGKLRLEGDPQSSTYEKVQDTVTLLEKISTKRSQSITINTGWIIADNIDLITELTDAKEAWLVSPKLKKQLSLIPIDKKEVQFDTEQTLYGFDVTFTINPNYNEENHASKVRNWAIQS